MAYRRIDLLFDWSSFKQDLPLGVDGGEPHQTLATIETRMEYIEAERSRILTNVKIIMEFFHVHLCFLSTRLAIMRKLILWVVVLAAVSIVAEVIPPLSHFSTAHINPSPFPFWRSHWRSRVVDSDKDDRAGSIDVA